MAQVHSAKTIAASPQQGSWLAPTVLAAGPWHHAEFAPVLNTLDPHANWPTTPTLADAIEHILARESPPDLVLLAQPRPGVDDQTDVDRLRQLAPITRVIVVAGSWCEGELRTGRPLTGVVRLYWYELPAWWRAAIERLAAGSNPPWTEPLTEIRAGQFIRFDKAMTRGERSAQAAAGKVAIDAKDYATFEALDTGLAAAGWTCVWQPRHRPHLYAEATPLNPTVAIWDGAQLDQDELQNLREFCTRMKTHDAPVLVLLDFPRAEHLEAAAGVAAVMAKPYQLSLLNNELARLTSEKAIPKGSQTLAGG